MYIKIVDLVVKLYAPRLRLDLVLSRLKLLEMYLEVSVQPQNMKTINLDFKKKKNYLRVGDLDLDLTRVPLMMR